MDSKRYQAHLALTHPGEEEYARQRAEQTGDILFAVIGMGEGDALRTSLTRQTYRNWRYLEGRDDPYAAAASVPGAVLLFLPNDSELTPDALYLFSDACRYAEFVYADDDDVLYDGTRQNPYYKPDFAPETLLSRPYIGFPFAVAYALFRRVAAREHFSDPMLTELSFTAAVAAAGVSHIPRILLSQRSRLPLQHGAPIAAALSRLGVSARVSDGLYPGSFRVRFPYPPRARVTVAVWNRYPYPVLKRTLETLEQSSVFDGYALLVCNTLTGDVRLDRYLLGLEKNRAARVLRLDADAVSPAVWNAAAAAADCPFILFLDAAFLPGGYHEIENLLEYCCIPGVGAVGGSLWDAAGARLSCGYTVGLYGGIGTLYRRTGSGRDPLENSFTAAVRNVSALPVCGMMLRRDVFFDAGGFDQSIPTGYDAAFCQRLVRQRLRCVFTPYASFRQHADRPLQKPVTQREEQRLMDTFRDALRYGDPHFNPNWDYNSDRVRVALPPLDALRLHQPGVWFR